MIDRLHRSVSRLAKNISTARSQFLPTSIVDSGLRRSTTISRYNPLAHRCVIIKLSEKCVLWIKRAKVFVFCWMPEGATRQFFPLSFSAPFLGMNLSVIGLLVSVCVGFVFSFHFYRPWSHFSPTIDQGKKSCYENRFSCFPCLHYMVFSY